MPYRQHQQLPSPKEVAAQVTHGQRRAALARMMFLVRATAMKDIFPDTSTAWGAISYGYMLALVFESNKSDRAISAAAIARETEIPRATVQRKLHKLVQMHALSQRGCRYVINPQFLNEHIEGFHARFRIIKSTKLED
jgi:hypothetical protein